MPDLYRLDFSELRRANNTRRDYIGDTDRDTVWWALALCGEAGELANLIKKATRGAPGDPSLDEAAGDIAYELADIVHYVDLLASHLGIDLGRAVARKYNVVSQRYDLPYSITNGEFIFHRRSGRWEKE